MLDTNLQWVVYVLFNCDWDLREHGSELENMYFLEGWK
jgi:hypothetical protein